MHQSESLELGDISIPFYTFTVDAPRNSPEIKVRFAARCSAVERARGATGYSSGLHIQIPIQENTLSARALEGTRAFHHCSFRNHPSIFIVFLMTYRYATLFFLSFGYR